MPFDALVEVGGALGPTFEAQAVNVSEDGIQLRTAYLPEAGQTLTCRFDAGPSNNVLASGEVVWAQGGEDGGEFAVRFTDVDAESVEALKGICGVQGESPVVAGSKVEPAPRPPKWSTGQMRRMALARMFLRGTNPNTRESLEKLRLSPITK